MRHYSLTQNEIERRPTTARGFYRRTDNIFIPITFTSLLNNNPFPNQPNHSIYYKTIKSPTLINRPLLLNPNPLPPPPPPNKPPLIFFHTIPIPPILHRNPRIMLRPQRPQPQLPRIIIQHLEPIAIRLSRPLPQMSPATSLRARLNRCSTRSDGRGICAPQQRTHHRYRGQDHGETGLDAAENVGARDCVCDVVEVH